MGLYNFKPQFVPFILDGAKTHTIRATRWNPDRPGSIMHLYTGLRRPGARCLMRCPCVKVESIRILSSVAFPAEIKVGGIWLSRDERELLARRDGFQSLDDMSVFWRGGPVDFNGHIYHWDPSIKLAPLRFSKGYGRANP